MDESPPMPYTEAPTKCPHCGYYSTFVDLHVIECKKNPDNVPYSKACESDPTLGCSNLRFGFRILTDGTYKGLVCPKRCGSGMFVPKNWV